MDRFEISDIFTEFKKVKTSEDISELTKKVILNYKLPFDSVPKKRLGSNRNPLPRKLLNNYLIYIIQLAWLKNTSRVISSKSESVFIDIENIFY